MVALVAARQEGMISTEQLIAVGVDRGAIAWRVRRGRLHPYHRGVYAVGHTRLTPRARLWAAVLACGGPGAALLGFQAAAAPLELMVMPSGRIDVIALRRSGPRPGIRVHRSKSLEPQDITHIDGLPLTTPTRTLIDLADQLTPHRLERVLHRAEILRILDVAAIHARLASLPAAVPEPSCRPSNPSPPARNSHAANSKSASWRLWPSTDCRAHSATRSWKAKRSTSTGPSTTSSSRPTASAPISTPPPSRKTAPATLA
jgi:hypothetical protein